MKTSVIEVRDMLSVLSVAVVEKRIGNVGGVESVTVNYAAGNAAVRYDETRLDIADIKADVRKSGYDDDGAPSAESSMHGHDMRSAPSSKSDAAHKAAPVANDAGIADSSASPSQETSAAAKSSSPVSATKPAGATSPGADTTGVAGAPPPADASKDDTAIP